MGRLADTNPKAQRLSGAVSGHKPQSTNLGGWRTHPEIMNGDRNTWAETDTPSEGFGVVANSPRERNPLTQYL